MAESPSHRFGQIIGEVLEAAIEPLLQEFSEKHLLYLDKKGIRAARKGKKLTWTDGNDNKHDLDFVIERGGSDTVIGVPIAFIESAWRRYTKHSRNKAQEIQGAIIPLVMKYSNYAPFYGAILAGDFTKNAIQQLLSLGFKIIYFEYQTIIDAFKIVGIDIYFEENTPDFELANRVKAWESLSVEKQQKVSSALIDSTSDQVTRFINALKASVTRKIELVRIIPLHGRPFDLSTVADAIMFVENYSGENNTSLILRYEVEIRYSNGDKIDGVFQDSQTAIEFLNGYK